MEWMKHLLFDFFFAVGAIFTFGLLVVLLFFDGQVSNGNTLWVFMPALIFAWLRGEIVHWPKEKVR